MEKISTSELIDKVADATGQTKKAVKQVLDETMHQVTAHVEAGCAVATKLGKFYPKDRAAKVGRNPQTGAAIEIHAKRVLAFKPSSTVKYL